MKRSLSAGLSILETLVALLIVSIAAATLSRAITFIGEEIKRVEKLLSFDPPPLADCSEIPPALIPDRIEECSVVQAPGALPRRFRRVRAASHE